MGKNIQDDQMQAQDDQGTGHPKKRFIVSPCGKSWQTRGDGVQSKLSQKI